MKTIEVSIGKRHWGAETVNEALAIVAKQLGCEKRDLTCEAAEPVYQGRMVWVWHGQFDADTAASLFVPTKTYIRWTKHRGICPLH